MLYHIVAMAKNNVIGNENKLPWHFPADLKHFKKLTSGSTVIMGRKTFESIGKPLKDRQNFVLTHQPKPPEENVQYFAALEEALKNISTPNAFIIGGASLYEQTIDRVDGIYLTWIDAEYKGDAFYPKIPFCFEEKFRKILQFNPTLAVIYYEKINRETKA